MNKPLTLGSLLGILLLFGTANAQTCTNPAIPQSTPTSDFTFSGDGKTVTNTATGLTWKRCWEGQTFSDNGTPNNYLDDTCTGGQTYNWQAALNQAQIANSTADSGYTDWRVPNRKELNSIVEHCRANPAINTEVFPSPSSLSVWTSSQVPTDATGIFIVQFDDGRDDGTNKNNSKEVRLVRSAQ